MEGMLSVKEKARTPRLFALEKSVRAHKERLDLQRETIRNHESRLAELEARFANCPDTNTGKTP